MNLRFKGHESELEQEILKSQDHKTLHKCNKMASWSGSDDCDRSGVDVERYAVLYVYTGCERNGMRLPDHIEICIVNLVGAWIMRREVVNRAKRIRSEKLKGHQYVEKCGICRESIGVHKIWFLKNKNSYFHWHWERMM